MRLAKHHGLGNDFLVLVHRPGGAPLPVERAVALCDRHEGIGADGLLEAFPADGRPDSAALVMVLHNADGSVGAMSGNGIRCLVHAAVLAGVVEGPDVAVATDAGVRRVSVLDAPAGPCWTLRVDMGPVRVTGEAPQWQGDGVAEALWVDAGNPHLVLLAETGSGGAVGGAGPDVAELGQRANAQVPGGVNVELVRPGPQPGAVSLSVFERGVGLTRACGTGACATAVAWHHWRGGPDTVEVAMPGGRARVELGPTVALVGPSVFVGTVEVDADALEQPCR